MKQLEFDFPLKNINSVKELKKIIKNGNKLIWNDPDPIEGNDYTITYIEELDDDTDYHYPILIQYGNGSEAQVFLHEIKYKI